jgi:transcriptional regulator
MKGVKKTLNMKAVEQVKKYLDMGLNQTEIAKLLETTRQQVNRWVQHIEKTRNSADVLDVDRNYGRVYTISRSLKTE